MPALLASREVRALLDREEQLRERIGDYLVGKNNWHTVPYALPAPAEDMAKWRRNRDKFKIEFPQVILRLRRVRHHLTAEVGVEVTCSDEDTHKIRQFLAEESARRQIARQKTLV